MAFRPHFLRVDAEARRLDEVYEGMTEGEKEAWEDWAAEHVGLARCASEQEGEEVPVKRYVWDAVEADTWYDLEGEDGVGLGNYAVIAVGKCNVWADAPDNPTEPGVVDIMVDIKFTDDTVVEMVLASERVYCQQSEDDVFVNDFAWRYEFSEEERTKRLKSVRWMVYVDDPGSAGIDGWLQGGAELLLMPETEDHALD
jgi:hypothetical protein